MPSEIRHALRRLRATPVVTLSVVVCLAIGVWMTSIMSAIALAWFRPNLHMPNADRLVRVYEDGLYSIDPAAGPIWGMTVSQRVYDAMTQDSSFTAVGHYDYYHASLEGDENSFVRVERFSASMMRVLQVGPILGRGFVPSDDTTGGVVILSHRFWQRRFGGDSGIIGHTLRFKQEVRPRTIIGVMPEDFAFPHFTQDVYATSDWAWPGPPNSPPYHSVLARLADGARRGDVEQRLRIIAATTVAADREDAAAWLGRIYKKRKPPELARGGAVTHVDRYFTEPNDGQTLKLILLILCCGFAVVAVAVANVVNLLLVRGAARRQEIAVRMALGAARARVVGELVLETLLLAAPAMLFGFLVAWRQWQAISPSYDLRWSFGEIDWRVALIATAAALGLSLMAGVWPGLRATSIGLEQVLRDARRSGITDSPLEGVLGRLVTASTGATVALLICAVLLGFSAYDVANDLTLAQQGILASDLTIDAGGTATTRVDLAKATLANLRGLPGVASAALGEAPEQGSYEDVLASLSGEPNRKLRFETSSVSDGYFQTMMIPMLRGRGFTVREARDSSGLVVISRDLAGTLFPGREAVGQRFRYRRIDDSTIVDAQVIGVVETASRSGMAYSRLYRSFGSARRPATSALVRYRRRVRPQPADVAKALQATSGVTSSPVASIAERTKRVNPVRRYLTLGFTMFAVIGLIIAVVGTYGVVAYSVVRRTHEIGVRLALGADSGRVSRMVIEQGLKITLVGVTFGVVLAAAAMRILGAFIMDLQVGYGGAIGGVIAIVCLLSFVASAVPAFRASRLNPIDALRAD